MDFQLTEEQQYFRRIIQDAGDTSSLGNPLAVDDIKRAA